VSRLEGFSDAVFGFALTLLVVSLEAPRTFDELAEALRGFVAFAICFALFMQIWLEHRSFFRRYALQDGWTVTLNALLLFVVLAYVYPLKFLFTLLGGELVGRRPLSTGGAPVITAAQTGTLMYVYGAGFVAIAVVFALMYANALRQAGRLELTALERHDTVTWILAQGVLAGVGLLSMAIVASSRPALGGLAYFAIGPGMWLLFTCRHALRGRRARRLAVASPEPTVPAPPGAGPG
jgi:uncharacterized membrane protein